jgi:hypothetical protein
MGAVDGTGGGVERQVIGLGPLHTLPPDAPSERTVGAPVAFLYCTLAEGLNKVGSLPCVTVQGDGEAPAAGDTSRPELVEPEVSNRSAVVVSRRGAPLAAKVYTPA